MPRLAPLAANAPRPPTGRCWSIRIIAQWAVSGQTWAFLLSHTHLRCPIIINAYFPLSYPVLTCIKTHPCCLKKSALFFPLFIAAWLDKNSKLKSHKSLKIKQIYYRYFLHKLLAINELCGILCHCKRGRFTNRPEAKNGQKTRWRKK